MIIMADNKIVNVFKIRNSNGTNRGGVLPYEWILDDLYYVLAIPSFPEFYSCRTCGIRLEIIVNPEHLDGIGEDTHGSLVLIMIKGQNGLISSKVVLGSQRDLIVVMNRYTHGSPQHSLGV